MRERGCGAHTKSAKAKAKATFHEREPSFDARRGLAHLEALHLHNHCNLHDTNTHQNPSQAALERSHSSRAYRLPIFCYTHTTMPALRILRSTIERLDKPSSYATAKVRACWTPALACSRH